MNVLAANPDAANPPAVAVPEALPLPIATAIIVVGDIARAAVITITVTRPVIAGAGKRAAHDGAADYAGRYACAKPTLRMRGR